MTKATCSCNFAILLKTSNRRLLKCNRIKFCFRFNIFSFYHYFRVKPLQAKDLQKIVVQFPARLLYSCIFSSLLEPPPFVIRPVSLSNTLIIMGFIRLTMTVSYSYVGLGVVFPEIFCSLNTF